jgi:hypothetical protein
VDGGTPISSLKLLAILLYLLSDDKIINNKIISLQIKSEDKTSRREEEVKVSEKYTQEAKVGVTYVLSKTVTNGGSCA